MEIVKKFSMSGTLGDAFTVFCKLAGYHKQTGNKIKLYRYSQNPEFDKPISEFFHLIPYIDYIAPSFEITWSRNKIEDCAKLIAPHVSTNWNGINLPDFPNDPENVVFEPYPEVKTSHITFMNDKFRVGIQLMSGKIGGNFKGLSLGWIACIRKYLPEDTFSVYLLGNGGGYSSSGLEVFCNEHKINNLVNKLEVREWLSYIKSMDFFITPEGFSAFFAMSQKTRSLVFYTDYQILARVHPLWRKENIIISAGQEILGRRLLNRISREIKGRNCLLKPLMPSQVYSLINAEKAYR